MTDFDSFKDFIETKNCDIIADKMHVSVFVETSEDGFIAAEDGSVSCFKECHAAVPKGETCGFREFLESVDAVVMGRKTFDVVKDLKTDRGERMWWYGTKPVFVLSRDASRVVIPASIEASGANITRMSGNPADILAKIGSLGFRHIYLDGGGDVIRQFMDFDLVDDATVTVVPISIGRGVPFIASDEHRSKLKVVSEKKFPFGFKQSKFIIEHTRGGRE